jgi:predicted amidohydrolase YtcJ
LKDFELRNPEQQWIFGRGWDQNKWPGKNFPVNDQLNNLFPVKYIVLERVDGHASIVNDKVLKLADITLQTKISGGELVSNNNNLTGVLVDNAVSLINKVLPVSSPADFQKWLTAAQQNCFKNGLTTVSDCGISNHDVRMLDSLQQKQIIKIRVYGLMSDEEENFAKWLPLGPYKTDKLFINGFKFYADGALGSRGACLLQPYNDRANWYGFMLKDHRYYDSMANVLSKTSFQMCTHAIGDSANRKILKVYNAVLKGKNDKRWRIEHAQVVNKNDNDLFGSASIIPSVQPTHATSDMYWAEDRLGRNRISDAYAYQALLKQNGWLPLGTDFPVEDISPFKTFYAAVFRKDANNFPKDGFKISNALTREQALKGITIWAAKASFLDKESGSIEKGKNADYIILDKDLMSAQPHDLLNIKVIRTIVGGTTVYKTSLVSPEGKPLLMD